MKKNEISIIELLKLVADGKKPPELIEFEGTMYIYKNLGKNFNDYVAPDYCTYLSDNITFMEEDLNKKVKIIIGD